MNYFTNDAAATRYARGRPFFHPLVVARISSFLNLRAPLRRALDVACGTGHSTLALQQLAAGVIGTDVSDGMLREAREAQRTRDASSILYVKAPAESLPFADASFDLITVSMAFHWFDRARFLSEAHRLLRPDAWLVVYNNFFFGTMQENPEFAHWHRNTYLARFPSPHRHSQPLTHAAAAEHGFRLSEPENYTNDVRFSLEELAHYFTTQSNIIAALEQATEPLDSIHAWLVSSLAPLFPAPTCTFNFGGYIWYMQKAQ
ncbi:MAG TPA: class I SAM-dependent methyltransferase [Pyrinomonadaceae bacterium]|jgi:ubiquinone/menaquinone biosynthesis C-methylase UbiE